MEESEYEMVIQWFGFQLYYNEMLHYAKEATESYSANKNLKIWHSLALLLTSHTRETTLQVSSLVNDVDLSLPALIIQKHLLLLQTTTTSNRALIDETENRIKESRKKSSPLSLALTGNVLLVLDNSCGKAQEYVNKAYKLDPSNPKVCLAKGWCELLNFNKKTNGGNKQNVEKLADYFANVVENDKDFGILLAKARLKMCLGDHSEAISILNTLIVRYSWSSIPLVEKMMNQLAMRYWDLALETSSNISSMESNNLESLKMRVIASICRDGDFIGAEQCLRQFFKSMIHNESKNAELVVSVIRLFSRVTNENRGIILELLKMTEKTLQQQQQSQTSHHPALLVEHGNLCLRVGDVKDAELRFRAAVQINKSSFSALIGLAKCQLIESSVEALDLARQQVDLLMEIQQSGSVVSPEIFLMSAILNKKRDDRSTALGYLEMAAKTILQDCEKLPYGYDYLIQLNPDFCIQLGSEYLQHLPVFNLLDPPHEAAKNRIEMQTRTDYNKQAPCMRVLELATEACPGFSNALLLLARVKMQLGDLEGSKAALNKLIETDSSNAVGYLLLAQLAAHQGNYHLVAQTLEVGTSNNFQVRDEPMYHALSGILARENGDYESCIEHLKSAISKHQGEGILAMSERATVYLELISAYGKIKKFEDAMRVMDQARDELGNTIEEGRVVIANAQLALEMADVDKAIQLLSQVTTKAPYYLQAHRKLAHVYLEHKNDRLKFAQCYKELVEQYPDAETYVLLGDAYVAIQEPEMAIEAYESAHKYSNKEYGVSSRQMGKALVKTHQYRKAVEYYENAIKHANCEELKLDFAELYIKMRQYDMAKNVLLRYLKDGSSSTDMNANNFEIRSKQLQLLAKIREKSGNVREALDTLNEAKKILVRQSRRRLSTSLTNLENKQTIVKLCLEAAEYASTMQDYEEAISNLREALNYTPDDINTMLAMAKLYLEMNDLDDCATSCTAALKVDPNNETASVMMADIAFRRVDFEKAAYHFRQILLQRPNYWTAMARLIEVSRRTGDMEKLDEWMSRAKEAVERSKDEAGYHYCAGLLDWRLGNLNSALRHFNAARRDPEWGQQAVYNMIQVCLDQDDEASTSGELYSEEDAEYQDTRIITIKTVQRLLQEFNPKGNPQEVLTRRLLGDFFLLATKQKSNIEKALEDFSNMASQESLKDHVGPALGLAMAHILLKQIPRARNHLKRVSKNTWTFEDAEYLERSWLLLANLYIQSSKYEIANELIKRVLQYNASSVRAHQLAALIMEKEQNFDDAILHYSLAWNLGGKNKLPTGYKLAYCYFKTKSYTNAIDVSYQVLKKNADYPRIRKDILEKSINNLRT